jgi:mono/diheme cytochrome c family protein
MMSGKKLPIFIALTLVLSAFLHVIASGQGWDIPADKKAKNSYIKFSDTTALAGQEIYTKNCLICHGDPGKGNSLKTLVPVPPDLASAKTQMFTDGELFYILSTGKLIMPSFKSILTEADRWNVISFMRSFNKKYVQVLSKTNPEISKKVKIILAYDSVAHKIRVEVKATEKDGFIPLKDAEIVLFASRYFGKLQIDKTLRTNNEGVAAFKFPSDLPGDKDGNVELVVNVNDDTYGEIESVQKMKVGIPTDKPGLTEKRAIWNVLKKAPWWIIFTYTSILLAVGSVLLYVIFNLRKLTKLGKI